MSQNLLEITGLRKSFPTRHGLVQAIDGVDLAVKEGTTTALVGESGSGKTTLGRSVLALCSIDSGSVLFDGKEMTELSARDLRATRRDAQMVFQAQSASLNPRMSVGAVLEEPLKLAGQNRTSRRARVREALRQVHLDEAYVERYPSELSGGEQQRVGIARAMITEPRLVVLDEPTAALDAQVRRGIYELLTDLQRRLGLTYLLISHDLSSVWGVADQVAVMHRGRIVECGPREEVFLDSRHPYTVALMTAAPHVGRAAGGHKRLVLKGDFDLAGDDLCRFAGRCPMATDACRTARPLVAEVGEEGHVAACWRTDDVPTELEDFRSSWHDLPVHEEAPSL